MIHLQVEGVTKTFGDVRAVGDVSLDTKGGEVFALLGPNGAGKTTLIRMIMDIIRPDAGSIFFDGGPISYELKHRIGYLPEERGLYKKQKVGEVVAFFGQLHGLEKTDAAERAHEWLARVDLDEWEKKKAEELSKGMQQKAQIALTLLHDPDLVILDEPFSGLDPVNTRMVKDFISELRRDGRTVLLSTHQMAQVEALADRVFMISRGKRVLYGTLHEIKQDHSDNAVLVNESVDPSGHDGVLRAEKYDGGSGLKKVWLKTGCEPRQFLSDLLRSGQPVAHFEMAETPLEDIFVKLAQEPVMPEVAS
jgi:ABC-2 type transport system ATP-binding protein